MPLIIITGLPCSGKTYRAQQIAADLNALIASDPSSHSKRRVQIVRSQHASSDEPYVSTVEPDAANVTGAEESLRDQIYNSAAREKTARAAEFSAIKRAVSKDTIVIADGLNYIKGYRYQLWCEAKAAATRCCVVHVAAREDECNTWNRERLRVWARVGGREPESDPVQRQAHSDNSRSGQANLNDILGHLVPESHTAIYGDRPARSRSWSLDGQENGEGEQAPNQGNDDDAAPPRLKPDDDTMTLKSLYITDRQNNAVPERGATLARTPHRQQQPQQALPSSSSPSPAPDLEPEPESEPGQASSLPSAHLEPPAPTASRPYSPATLASLAMRYEPPSPFSRWDTPLFTIPSSDSAPPTPAIWAALFPPPATPTSRKALSQIPAARRDQPQLQNQLQNQIQPRPRSSGPLPLESSSLSVTSTSASTSDPAVKPHAATVLPKATASDALQILESATMDVTKHLLARAREQLGAGGPTDGNDGGHVALSVPTPTVADPNARYETTLYIPAGVVLSQPILQRLRRKYTQIQRGGIAHGQGYVHGRPRVVEDFVDFLDREWNDAD